MLSKHEEQAERRETLENDRRVREPSGTSASGGSTFLSHTHNDVGGRFSAISNPTVIGSTQVPNYPAGPNWCADDQGLEPPFPVDISAVEPVGEPHEIRASSLGPSEHSDQATPNPSSQVPPLAAEGLGFSQRAYRRF